MREGEKTMVTQTETDGRVMLPADRAEAVRNLLADAAMRLDREDWDGFLSLCDDRFHYEVVADSADLGMEMRWLDHSRAELLDMFRMIPKHVRMSGRLARHVATGLVAPGHDGGAEAISAVMLVHTAPGGESRLIASGRYHDRVAFADSGTACLAARRVELDTVTWSPGLHVPV